MLDWDPGRLTVDDMAQHTLGWIERADTELLREGKLWYVKAHLVAGELGRVHGVPLEHAAATIAALSPQTPWKQNVIDADKVLRGDYNVTAYPNQVAKALRVLNGEPWQQVLKGPKENPFAATIIDPEHRVPVGDTWMCRVPMPRSLWFNDKAVGRVRNRKGPFARLQQGIVVVADALNWLVSEVQATTWCSIRGGAA